MPGVLYEVQVRKSVAGAAGPTAGALQEDMQADRSGLDLTMTPADHVLHPPTKAEDQGRVQLRAQQKAQEESKNVAS